MAARTEKVAVTRAERRSILSCLDGSLAGVDSAVLVARALTGDDNIDADTVLTHGSYGSNFTGTRAV